MPEVISKYPDVTLKVLKEAGLKCGEGLPQKILTQCPRERFCSAPSGEVCVYGVDNVNQTTQFQAQDLAQIFEAKVKKETFPAFPPPELLISFVVIGLVLTFLTGFLLGKRKR